MAQLRRSSGDERSQRGALPGGQLPTFATGYISHEIRQIVVTTGIMMTIIVVLALVMR